MLVFRGVGVEAPFWAVAGVKGRGLLDGGRYFASGFGPGFGLAG